MNLKFTNKFMAKAIDTEIDSLFRCVSANAQVGQGSPAEKQIKAINNIKQCLVQIEECLGALEEIENKGVK